MRSCRSGWSWDLAYYNQWFWAVTQGEGTVTVRPISFYAKEGPSVWKMNYLAPIRLVLVAVLCDPSRPANPARDPERDVLVGHPGGLRPGAVGVGLRAGRALGRARSSR